MQKQRSQCDPSRLAVLLSADEQSDQFLLVASHVEDCRECQLKLTDLAADSQTWNEIRDSLVSEAAFNVRRQTEQSAQFVPRDPSDANLDFLSPAGHPELLGRLGRYTVESVIGSGGMGIVLKGFDSELNRPVALKILGRHLAHSGAARQRFAREARAAAAVVHEQVVAIHNVESDDVVPFLVMQYVSGESLQVRVDRDGPLEAREVLRIGMQVAAGLAAAHEQGLVHRDVKPANILLENGVERALLTDFGLARTVDDASLTHTGTIAGTPHYMSPEQANGAVVDWRSDLFSLGAVLYFMASGHPPFRADRAMGVLNRICHDRHRPVWQVKGDVPDALSDIIDRLLEKRPQKRIGSAAEARAAMADALARLQEPRSSRQSFVRRVGPTRLMVAGIAILLAGALVVASGNIPHVLQRPASGERHGASELPQTMTSLADVAPSSTLEALASEVERKVLELEMGNVSHFLQEAGAEWHAEVNAIRSQSDALEKALNSDRNFNP